MTNDTDDDLADLQAFALPTGPHHPADIAARLMLDPEHAHLTDNDIGIGYLMRLGEKLKGGKRELGSVCDSKYMAQGGFKDLFVQLLAGMLGHYPPFIMVLDKEFWDQASDTERDALVWHELCHIRQKVDQYGAPKFDMHGNPSYGIQEHDVTAFKSEVARFGAWSPDLREFLAVANKGGF
jgi:hypothetical protein